MIRRGLLVLLAGLAWAWPAAAQLDLPPLTGRVVDRADVLPPEVEAALAGRLAAHEAATSNQVVVATVESLQGADVATFANELFRAWRLGQADRDNGVLLLVAPTEREVRIEVGYGLEGDLTDAESFSIVRNAIVPRFREGDFPGGIEAGVAGILAAIEGSYAPVEAPAAEGEEDAIPAFLIFALVFVFIMFQRARQRRAGHTGGGFRSTRHHRPGGWSSGGGGWRGSSGGRSGGFSGGGGSSGGGGASGRW